MSSPTLDDLDALCAQMDGDREQRSWSTTFREYKERELALDRDRCSAEIVIIDGPLVTQNLMTQPKGRAIIPGADEFVGGAFSGNFAVKLYDDNASGLYKARQVLSLLSSMAVASLAPDDPEKIWVLLDPYRFW